MRGPQLGFIEFLGDCACHDYRRIMIGEEDTAAGKILLELLKSTGLDARPATLDLLKPDSIRREIESVKPVLVVHLAGQQPPLVRQCILR